MQSAMPAGKTEIKAVLEHLPWGPRARRTSSNPNQRCHEGTCHILQDFMLVSSFDGLSKVTNTH